MEVGGGVTREKDFQGEPLGKGRVTWASAQCEQGWDGRSPAGTRESSAAVYEPFLHQPGALAAEG